MVNTEKMSDWRNEYHKLCDVLSGLKAELDYVDVYLSRNKYEPFIRKTEITEKQRLEAEIADTKLKIEDLEKKNEIGTAGDNWQ